MRRAAPDRVPGRAWAVTSLLAVEPGSTPDLLALRDAAIQFYEEPDVEERWARLGALGREFWARPGWPELWRHADDIPLPPRVIEVDLYLVAAGFAMVSVACADADSFEPMACTGHRLWVREPDRWAPTEAHPEINDDFDWGVTIGATTPRTDHQFWALGAEGWARSIDG